MTSEASRTFPPETPEAARYIASLAEELAELAKRHGLDALAHVLKMAQLEADQICKRWDAARETADRGAGA